MIFTNGNWLVATTRDELVLFAKKFDLPDENFIEDKYAPRYRITERFILKRFAKKSKFFKHVYFLPEASFRELMDARRFNNGQSAKKTDLIKREAYYQDEDDYGITTKRHNYNWEDVEDEARSIQYDPANAYNFKDLLI